MDYKKYFEDNLETLLDLLRIKSVYDKQSVSKDAPYGKGVKDALLFMKELALKDGFVVKEYDNQVISVSYNTNEERHIDVASHLDVVSTDDNWSHDPFDPIIVDGKIIGRGTADMKAALFLSYLALKLLRERHPETPNEIRLVFGTDEERTMNDMKYYYSKITPPLFALSPDGKFPLAIGEKGALMWTLKGNVETIIESLNGGLRCNIVAPSCETTLKNNLYTNKIKSYVKRKRLNATVDEVDNKTHIIISGKAVHASRAFLGSNAINKTLKVLAHVCNDELSNNLYKTLSSSFGFGFITKISDVKIVKWLKQETFLTVNLGVLKIKDGKISGQVDSRYPSKYTSEYLTNKLKEKLIVDVSLDYDDEPTECDINDVYVRTLLNTYREVVKEDKSEPWISGGVSYSKVFKHCVTYGLARLKDEYVAHQVNEFIRIERCVEALEIFDKAFEKLAFIKEEK